jgi:hypothetical protein
VVTYNHGNDAIRKCFFQQSNPSGVRRVHYGVLRRAIPHLFHLFPMECKVLNFEPCVGLGTQIQMSPQRRQRRTGPPSLLEACLGWHVNPSMVSNELTLIDKSRPASGCSKLSDWSAWSNTLRTSACTRTAELLNQKNGKEKDCADESALSNQWTSRVCRRVI